jgi:deoxycytidylate deaminase
MMIQAGIVKVVYERANRPESPETLARWLESTTAALEMLAEAGVEVVVVEKVCGVGKGGSEG